MTATSLDELFLRELRLTHQAETVVLRALPEFAEIAGSLAAALDGYAEKARERITRLEHILNRVGSADATEASALSVLGKIEEYVAGIGDPEMISAVAQSELLAARHYLIARYAMLLACANKLRENELAEFANRARAYLAQTLDASNEPRDQYKGITMGERLSAMFYRKK